MTPKRLTSAPLRTELPGVGVGETGGGGDGAGRVQSALARPGPGPVRPLGGDAERALQQGGSRRSPARARNAPPRCVPRTRGKQTRRRLSPAPRHSVNEQWGGLKPEPPPAVLSSGWRRQQHPQRPAQWRGRPQLPRRGHSEQREIRALLKVRLAGPVGSGCDSLSLTRPGELIGPSRPQHSSR